MAGLTSERVVIIGSGLAGLTVATLLAHQGVESVVIEKRAVSGGYNSPHIDAGYRFDIGATMLQTPKVLRDTFAAIDEDLDQHLQLTSLDPLYRTWFSDGEHLDLKPSIEQTANEIARFSAADARGFHRYAADMERHKRTLKRLFIEGAASPRAMLGPGVPSLLRSLNPTRSVQDLAARYFETPHVRTALTFQCLYWGTDPSQTPAPYGMVPYFEAAQGVWHVQGGINAISQAMTAIYLARGGTIRYGDPVEKIVVQGGRVRGVRLAGGEFLSAERVVSNADALYTYRRLVDPSLLPPWFHARLRRMALSSAAQVALIGLRSPDALPGLPHHTFMMPVEIDELSRRAFTAQAVPPPSCAYICVPTKTDPSVAPAERTAVYALALIPRGRRRESWKDARERAVDRVLGELAERGALDSNVEVDYQHVYQPPDFADDFNQPNGMGFGIQPTLRQAGPFRFGSRSRMVEGLYLAGASANPGGGIPLVLASGRAAARAVLRDARRRP